MWQIGGEKETCGAKGGLAFSFFSTVSTLAVFVDVVESLCNVYALMVIKPAACRRAKERWTERAANADSFEFPPFQKAEIR